MIRIGVPALQGAFAEHIEVLEKLSAECFEIRSVEDLKKPFDGLVLCGGESTVQGKLLKDPGLFEPLLMKIRSGLPVLGTCAGLILLAKEIENDSRRYFGCLDVTVVRNAYGRQLGSFETEGEFKRIGKIPMTFIRAPYIVRAGRDAEILSVIDGKITAVREKNMLATAFHPELTRDCRIHRMFLDTVEEYMQRKSEKFWRLK